MGVPPSTKCAISTSSESSRSTRVPSEPRASIRPIRMAFCCVSVAGCGPGIGLLRRSIAERLPQADDIVLPHPAGLPVFEGEADPAEIGFVDDRHSACGERRGFL